MPDAAAAMPRRFGRAIGRWYSVILVLAAWEAISRSGLVSPRLMPNLERIAAELGRFAQNGDLVFHSLITLQRAFIGFGAAVVCGIALGTLLARARRFEALFEPTFLFLYPVPKISLYPMFIFIFGLGDMSKIVLVFLECLYPITMQTALGMRSADRVLVWAARNMGANPTQLFWRVLAPSAAPAVFTGLRIALPVALIVTIITEIIGESRGLGYLVSFESASLEYARAMAALLIIGVVGFVLDRLLVVLRRRLVYWQAEEPTLG